MKQKKKRYCVFYPYLYVGDGVKNVRLVKWRLTHGAGQLTIHVIAEAPGSPAHLAIMHAANLKQSYYETHPVKVYGLASGAYEAKQMLVAISDEACRCGYEGELKRYLDDRLRADQRESLS